MSTYRLEHFSMHFGFCASFTTLSMYCPLAYDTHQCTVAISGRGAGSAVVQGEL